MKVTLNKQDEKRMKQIIGNLKKFPHLAQEAFENFAIDAVQYAQERAPVDTGNLRRSIHFKPVAKGIEVIAEAPYAGFVEFGTRFQRAQPFFEPAISKALKRLNTEMITKLNALSK